MAIMGVHDRQWFNRRVQIRKDPAQPTVAQMRQNHITGGPYQAKTVQSGFNIGVGIVDDDVLGHPNSAMLTGFEKTPFNRSPGPAGKVTDGVVMLEVFDRVRHAMGIKIFWRSANNPLDSRNALGYQARRHLRNTCTYDAIDTLLDKINDPVTQGQCHVDVRVVAPKLGKIRDQIEAREGGCCIDPKIPFGAPLPPGKSRFRDLDIPQDFLATIIVSAAFARQTELSRCAVEQPNAQICLQILDSLRNRRGGQ